MTWPDYCFQAPPPEAIARDLADTIRRAALGVARNARVPCDLDAVCEAGGFTTEWSSLDGDGGPSARLVTYRSKPFKIIVNLGKDLTAASLAADQALRQSCRFVIAREIGRSFFFDRSMQPAAKLTPESAAEEEFCDALATELLLPSIAINRYAVSPGTIFLLHRSFDVSVEVAARVAARRWADTGVIGLASANDPLEESAGLEVRWCAGPLSVPIGDRLHSTAVTRACGGGRGHEIELMNLGDLQGEFDVQAAAAPDRKLIVVVISLARRPAGADP